MLSSMGFRVWATAGLAACVCTACAGASAIEHPAAVLRDAGPPAAGAHPARAWHVPRPPHGRGAYLMVRLRRPLNTRFGTVRPRTQFGKPVWVPVLARRGARAAVLAPLRPFGRVVHMTLSSLALRWTRMRVVVDLASSRLTVLRGRRRLGSFPVGQGTTTTPTPTGRFFVTDRLKFGPRSPYAPYALGLSAHQTHLAPTWIGGDQIAIHPGPMGPVSNGCIHVGPAAIALLRRVAPLGTLVIVRR
jgi:hypothetical protein